MNKIFIILFFCFPFFGNTQEELIPLTLNPYIQDEFQVESGNDIDSTFQYNYSNLELPVFDDFSTNKWIKFPTDFNGAGVTSTQFYHLFDIANGQISDPNIEFCDTSLTHHDTVVVSGTTTQTYTSYFNTGIDISISDLNEFPISNNPVVLYTECYTLIDSIIDGVPDPTQDTIFYTPNIIQDSARVFFSDITSTDIWTDFYACHSYHMAYSPLSLGVATLDAVASNGYPYQFGSPNSYGDADMLTSKPINLAGKSNVFLSFVYQSKGFGNAPESLDSLVLEFYAPTLDIWYDQWSIGGLDVVEDEWNTGHIKIDASNFLQDGFKFRFSNKASLSGNLDHWHIDYVNLRDNSSEDDTVINDLAVVYPISTLLNDFTAVPWDHYNNLSNPIDAMKSQYDLLVSNNDQILKLTTPGTLNIDGNSFSVPVASQNWSLGENIYTFDVGDQPYSYPQNSSLESGSFDVKMNISTSSTNLITDNDTTYFTQEFKNFYAYDDGTAESGYGLLNNNAELAYRFEAYEADTLVGVLMKFVPNVGDVTGNVFLLTVWGDNNGEPGDIIYQDDFFKPHFPDYAAAKNQYEFYTFNDGQSVSVPKIFYVGWEQIEDENLYIGYDKNNNAQNNIFFNTGGAWSTSSFQGSLIIRPVMSTSLNHTLGIETPEQIDRISIYPNPVQDQLFINGLEFGDNVKVHDLTGKLMYSGKQANASLSNYAPGFYIVSVINELGELIYTNKIIKQ